MRFFNAGKKEVERQQPTKPDCSPVVVNVYNTVDSAKLDEIIQNQKLIMKELEDLTAQVEAQDTVIASAVTLLNGLSEKIANLEPDAKAIAALAQEVKGNSDALAAAVTANTPSEEGQG